MAANAPPNLSGAVDALIEKAQKSTTIISAITENNTTFLNNIREKLKAVRENLARLQGMNAGQSAQQIRDLNAQIQQNVQELDVSREELARLIAQVEKLTNEKNDCDKNLDGEKKNSEKLTGERQEYQDQLQTLILEQQPILARISELTRLVDDNMAQLQQFVDKAADPVILSEIDAANNTINELVAQLNPQAGGKRKSRKKHKTKTKRQRGGNQRGGNQRGGNQCGGNQCGGNQQGGWMYQESAVSSNYSKRIPSNKITSDRMFSSQISSKGKVKSSSNKDKSSSSKTRKGKR